MGIENTIRIMAVKYKPVMESHLLARFHIFRLKIQKYIHVHVLHACPITSPWCSIFSQVAFWQNECPDETCPAGGDGSYAAIFPLTETKGQQSAETETSESQSFFWFMVLTCALGALALLSWLVFCCCCMVGALLAEVMVKVLIQLWHFSRLRRYFLSMSFPPCYAFHESLSSVDMEAEAACECLKSTPDAKVESYNETLSSSCLKKQDSKTADRDRVNAVLPYYTRPHIQPIYTDDCACKTLSPTIHMSGSYFISCTGSFHALVRRNLESILPTFSTTSRGL